MGDDQGPRTKIEIKARAGPGVGKSHPHRRRSLPVPGGRGTGTKPRQESLSLVYEMGTRNFCTQAQEGNKEFGPLCIHWTAKKKKYICAL